MLYVCTWLWGTKWGPQYVDRLVASFRRNLTQPVRFVVATDQLINVWVDRIVPIAEADGEILAAPGCLVRMRMFDPAWQGSIGMVPGDRLVNVDVDAVVTGNVDELFTRRAEFTVMQGFNGTNPCPFNGSLWMVRAGVRHDAWSDFSLQAYRDRRVPYHAFPDDQGWLHHKFPDAAAYTPKDGVYAFKKNGWGAAGRRALPPDARFVAFPGRDPAKYQEVDWVMANWRC